MPSSRIKSVIPYSVLTTSLVSFTNDVGSLITSVTKTGTPQIDTFLIDLRAIEGVNHIVVMTADDKHEVFRTLYVTAGATYASTLINGLTIVIGASKTVGSTSKIKVYDVTPIGSVSADNGVGSLVGNGMKVVQIRTVAGIDIVATTNLAVVDCRGYSGISFHANVTSVNGTGLTTSYLIKGGITNVAGELAQSISPGVANCIFVGAFSSTGRKSGPINACTHPYMCLTMSGDATNRATADIWAILHTNHSGQSATSA